MKHLFPRLVVFVYARIRTLLRFPTVVSKEMTLIL